MELPTITFEEAHKKEEEYRNKLKMTRCRPVGSNFHQVPIRVRIYFDLILSFQSQHNTKNLLIFNFSVLLVDARIITALFLCE